MAETRKGKRGGGGSQASRGTPTLVRMVRAKSPAQLQYTGMLVSFTPWHLRQICNEEQPWSPVSPSGPVVASGSQELGMPTHPMAFNSTRKDQYFVTGFIQTCQLLPNTFPAGGGGGAWAALHPCLGVPGTSPLCLPWVSLFHQSRCGLFPAWAPTPLHILSSRTPLYLMLTTSLFLSLFPVCCLYTCHDSHTPSCSPATLFHYNKRCMEPAPAPAGAPEMCDKESRGAPIQGLATSEH